MNLRPLLVLTGLALSTCWLIAEPVPSPTRYNEALRAELLAIREADQSVRVDYDKAGRQHGWNSPELQPLREAMLKADAINLPRITALIDQRGWIGPEEVGPDAADTLFLVIQHADPLTQQKYLPRLRQAVQDKKASARDLAMMEDRVALAEGRRQTYGTQLMSDYRDGKMHVRPIEDPAHVDERRASVGLRPMSEYLQHMNLTWDVAAHEREIPWLDLIQLDTVPSLGKSDPALQAQLLAILQNDQEGRRQVGEIQKKHGPDSPEVAALWKDIAAKDAANLAQVTAILDTQGWVGPEVVGSRASSALFLVIQHAELPVQKKYLPMLQAAVAARKARAADLALLEDRIAVRENRPQIYGSQLTGDKDGHYRLSPLEDPDRVDERRASVGLEPIAQYLQHWNIPWDPAAYKKENAAAK